MSRNDLEKEKKRGKEIMTVINKVICLPIFSSPELAQGELLGYRDVRRTCRRP